MKKFTNFIKGIIIKVTFSGPDLKREKVVTVPNLLCVSRIAAAPLLAHLIVDKGDFPLAVVAEALDEDVREKCLTRFGSSDFIMEPEIFSQLKTYFQAGGKYGKVELTPPSLVGAKCFHTLGAYVRLITLLVKHSGETQNTATKVNLLNKEFDTKRYAKIEADFHVECGYARETDLFIAGAVLQLVCVKKRIVAAIALDAFAQKHPEITSHDCLLLPNGDETVLAWMSTEE